jgi:hypothetical protein
MLCVYGFLQAHNDGEVPGEEVTYIKRGAIVSAPRLPSLTQMSWYCDGPGLGGRLAQDACTVQNDEELS